MNRRGALPRLLLALLAGIYLLGASGAAVACATSDCAGCITTSPDCVHHMANDCTSVCAAVIPQPAKAPSQIMHRPVVASVDRSFVAIPRSGPEPPPPRGAPA